MVDDSGQRQVPPLYHQAAVPPIGLAEARAQAVQIIADAQVGVAPEVRKKREEKGTFGAVAADFMRDFAHSHRTRKEMQRKIDVELVAWHDRPIREITRSDIKERLREKARDGGIAANRLLALISKIFNWAVDEEIIEASPAMRLQRPGEEKDRERVLSAEEIAALWPAFDGLGYPFGDLYKMMLCTAQRRGEVASMKWSQIGADGWRLPAAQCQDQGRPSGAAVVSRSGDHRWPSADRRVRLSRPQGCALCRDGARLRRRLDRLGDAR